MIYALIGESCSGKSMSFNKLMNLGYETTISYTTRPKRPDETDGKEYNFITKEYFKYLNEIGHIVAPREYNGWFYGMSSKSIDDSKKQIVIVDPKGYRDLVHDIGDHRVIGIYLKATPEIRLLRGLNRGDDVNELVRRLQADKEDFLRIEEEVDFVIPSEFREIATNAIISIVEGDNK